MAVACSRRPPALRHGLASRFAREADTDQADELAVALAGTSPRTPAVMDAAGGAAEEVLHLHRVRRQRRLTFTAGALVQAPDFGEPEALFQEVTRAALRDDAATVEGARLELVLGIGCSVEEFVRIGQRAYITSMSEKAHDLKTLDEYERRSCSRLRKALRRLDYEKIEAERRAADSAAQRR